MKKSPVSRKRVMVQLAVNSSPSDPFYGVAVSKRKFNFREKNSADKMAKDFAEFMYNHSTSEYWRALKKHMQNM
jgi:hypothetical protein